MKLSERICQKYPANLLFAPAQLYRPVLNFDGSFSSQEQSRITGLLSREMNVSLDWTDGYPERQIQLGKGPRYVHISCDGFRVYFDREFYLAPMCWMIYALAVNAGWAAPCNERVVTVKVFSAKQQFLAMKFKNAVRQQLTGIPDIQKLAQEIANCVREASEQFGQFLPSLCCRPLTEEGWELVLQRNSFLSRLKASRSDSREWVLKDLAAALFGELDIGRELDSWIQFTKGLPAFEQEVRRSKKKIRNILFYSCLLADIDNVIAKAKDILYNDDQLTADSLQQDIEEVRDALDHFKTVDRLRAEDLESYFTLAARKYEYAAKRILRRELSSILLEEAGPDISEERKAATAELQKIERDLKQFCPMSGTASGTRLDLSWRQFGQIDDSLLFIDSDSWDGSSFSDLSMNVSTENLVAWLLMDELCKYSEIQNTHGGPYLKPVAVKDWGFAAAVFAALP